MAGANLFRALGLFIFDDFLTEAECVAYRTAIANTTSEKASVRKQGLEERVDEDRRKVRVANVAETTTSALRAGVNHIKPHMDTHFGCRLADCETPQFLTYRPGDFYRPHSDGSLDLDAPDYVRQRRVSLVVFLNPVSEQPRLGCYGGGELIFHGLIEGREFEPCGLPFRARAGALVAFPSHVVHEVRPVTHGERHTVVTWLHSTCTP